MSTLLKANAVCCICDKTLGPGVDLELHTMICFEEQAARASSAPVSASAASSSSLSLLSSSSSSLPPPPSYAVAAASEQPHSCESVEIQSLRTPPPLFLPPSAVAAPSSSLSFRSSSSGSSLPSSCSSSSSSSNGSRGDCKSKHNNTNLDMEHKRTSQRAQQQRQAYDRPNSADAMVAELLQTLETMAKRLTSDNNKVKEHKQDHSAEAEAETQTSLTSSSSSSSSISTLLISVHFPTIKQQLLEIRRLARLELEQLQSENTRLHEQLLQREDADAQKAREQAEAMSQLLVDSIQQQEKQEREAKAELGRIRAEEMEQREKERAKLLQQQRQQAEEFSLERIKVEDAKDKEVRDKEKEVKEKERQVKELAEREAKAQQEKLQLEQQLENVKMYSNKLASSSSSGRMLPEEAAAMASGKLARISIKPSKDWKGEDDLLELHFRLAESQFYRMCGAQGRSNKEVTEVIYIVNPKLITRYNTFKAELAKVLPALKLDSNCNKMAGREYLTFHGTSPSAVNGIVEEGFKIGGQGVAVATGNVLGTGIYLSAQTNFALNYQKNNNQDLLFARICVSDDTYIKKDPSGEYVEQFVAKNVAQVLPVYIVRYKNV